MSSYRTVEEKIGDWKRAFDAVKVELTPPEFVDLARLAHEGKTDGVVNVQSVNIGLAAARIVFANDRAAATVAALVTQTGVKPMSIDYGENE
jgi:hypothetical protein